MTDKTRYDSRLITSETRPDLYFALKRDERAANDDEQLREFQRQFRRRHPILTFLSWVADSNWRMILFLVGTFVVGGLITGLLP